MPSRPQAYRYLIESAGIWDKIKEVLKDLDTHDMHNLSTRGKKVRDLIYNAPVPKDLRDEIVKAYKKLCDEYGPNTDVAVRSSATAEDLPDASFAGQQETYLNIRGEEALIDACKRCFASLFTDRAISYRVDKGFNYERSSCPSGCRRWCAPTSAPRASCSPSTRNRASRTPSSSRAPTAWERTSFRERSIRTSSTSSSPP